MVLGGLVQIVSGGTTKGLRDFRFKAVRQILIASC